jgi:putative methanogenesis marker 13 metalloprotein
MYTLRDLDADAIVVHGPAGCGFTQSRLLEEAGVRVFTTAMQEGDLIFGAEEKLVSLLKKVEEDFDPELIGVVGTCASMIIGENLDSAVKNAGIRTTVIAVDTHGCLGANTIGAIKVLEAAWKKGVISKEEFERQRSMLEKATDLESRRGMTSRPYLEPHKGATKLRIARHIVKTLEKGGKVAVVLNAKKETAFRFADLMRAIEHARSIIGGETLHMGNLDSKVGLARIKGYASAILSDLDRAGVRVEHFTGGLDEYPVSGERAAEILTQEKVDLRVICGLPHALPDIQPEDVLVTDQPRELRNLLDMGFTMAVGEISTHSALMGATGIVHSETGDTIRELVT